MNKAVGEITQDLIEHGGAVVSSSDCHVIELDGARADGRFYTNSDGFGFVRRTQEWLNFAKNAVKLAGARNA